MGIQNLHDVVVISVDRFDEVTQRCGDVRHQRIAKCRPQTPNIVRLEGNLFENRASVAGFRFRLADDIDERVNLVLGAVRYIFRRVVELPLPLS